jgi:hypothetical protein
MVRFALFRPAPEDLKDLRGRIASALAAKCPKLEEARAAPRYLILVLESDDLALGNYVDIA